MPPPHRADDGSLDDRSRTSGGRRTPRPPARSDRYLDEPAGRRVPGGAPPEPGFGGDRSRRFPAEPEPDPLGFGSGEHPRRPPGASRRGLDEYGGSVRDPAGVTGQGRRRPGPSPVDPPPPPGRRPPVGMAPRRPATPGTEFLDDPPPGARVPVPPVRRLVSLTVAGFAGLLMVGLVMGAQTTRVSYAVVILGVQAVFVMAWTLASRPPAPRVVATVGLMAALVADGAAAWVRPASLTPLAYVTAAAFLAGVIGQLSRVAGRIRVTESLASTLVVVLGVVAFAMLVVLTRHPLGTQAIVACLAAAGVSLVVARLVDIVLPIPRLAPQVPRGGLGVVLGAMAGTAAAAAAGYYLAGLHPRETAIAGLIAAVVAAVVDLSVGYADAGRQLAGETPALWLARHLQGPLGGFALAAPAVYVTSALLLVPAL